MSGRSDKSATDPSSVGTSAASSPKDDYGKLTKCANCGGTSWSVTLSKLSVQLHCQCGRWLIVTSKYDARGRPTEVELQPHLVREALR